MRAVEIRGGFGLDHLETVERPDPSPGPGQALVRLRAASLNYRDLLTVEGKYNPKLKLPLIPCSDGAGEVVATGDGVTRVRPGDRVCGIFAQAWIAGEPTRERLRSTLGGPLDGTLAELAVYDQEGLVRIPEHLTDEEAATLPCAGVTAWTCLQGITAGDTVLLQGTGGVSIFALQLARLRGARVILTSSSDEKLARARELGGPGPEILGINYRETADWGARAKELTGGTGVDLVVEVGGAGTLKQSLHAVRMGGTISLIGNLAGNTAEIPLPLIFMQNVRVQGILVGPRDSFEALNRAITLHDLRPVVDRVFPLAEVRAAFEHMAAGGHFGKIVVRIAA
ncbi:MAG TPA: NAD(P)-dependent alcohol dehydrogenase [Thermoanaerobaculia bacterium]|nr:NAD(P)-dependent alcohol dehydrogenase [Thermoanaerobaculia bacterium]